MSNLNTFWSVYGSSIVIPSNVMVDALAPQSSKLVYGLLLGSICTRHTDDLVVDWKPLEMRVPLRMSIKDINDGIAYLITHKSVEKLPEGFLVKPWCGGTDF